MRWHLAAVPVAAGLFLVGTAAFSEGDTIPEWIKQSANWWADGLISDAEYISSLQWLVDNGYLSLDTGETQRLVQDGKYSIEHPEGWERQVPIREELPGGIRDSIIKLDTINDNVPSIISVSTSRMLGENIEEHRAAGLELIEEYLGDAFVHTLAESVEIEGNPGYVDEYTVSIFSMVVQGRSYSFEYEDMLYEIKYESDADVFPDNLAQFERLVQTFRLE